MSWREAEGECEDFTHWLLFPESISRIPCKYAKPEACPLGQSSWTSNEASFSERLEMCFTLLSVQCPGGSSLPRTISWIFIVPWDPGTQVCLATKGHQGAHPTVIETESPDIKTRTADVGKSSHPGNTGASGCGRG